MNLEALAVRNANAVDRIRNAALRLADLFGLSEQAQTLAEIRHRDPQVAALLEREAVAALLEGIVAATGGYPAPPEPAPEALPPVEEPADAGVEQAADELERRLDEAAEEQTLAGAPEPAPALDSLIAGIGPEIAEVLRERGIRTPADLASASDETLLGVPGLSKARVRRIRQQVAALQHPEH